MLIQFSIRMIEANLCSISTCLTNRRTVFIVRRTLCTIPWAMLARTTNAYIVLILILNSHCVFSMSPLILYHTSVQMQDFTAVSKVLHNLMVLTTSSVNMPRIPYTSRPILTMAITNEDSYVGNKLRGEAELLIKLTTPGALPYP